MSVDDASRFEDAVLAGQVLVVVHTEDVDLDEEEVQALLNAPPPP
jgi:hypothetical protein